MFEGNQLLSLINRLRGAFIGRDEGITLPFADFGAVGGTGISANGYMMLASCYQIPVLIGWTQAVYVNGTNDGSNYWTIKIDDGVTPFASINTSAMSGSTWGAFVTTSFTQPTGTPPSGWLGIYGTKTGTPGALLWAGALLRFM